MPALCRCAQSQHRGLQKEALWALGSVSGSPGPAGVAAVQQAGAVPLLVALLKGGAFDIRKEAAFALANITAGVHPMGGQCSVLNNNITMCVTN